MVPELSGCSIFTYCQFVFISAISIWSTKEIIRSFVINGIIYGRDAGSYKNHISLQINENVLSIRYSNSLESNRLHQICGLSFVTNMATYGPYTNDIQCGNSKYTVKVPGDKDFEDFISSDAIYDDDLTVLGFKSQKTLTIWHGQTDIATYSTDSGEYSDANGPGYWALDNMFDDENKESIWHSSNNAKGTVQTLTISFLSPIHFEHLKIKKRLYFKGQIDPDYNLAWLNVCLVLNNDVANQLCTNEQKGFSDSDQDDVIWTLPTNDVTTVELVFRDTGTYGNRHSGNAAVRDLKIFYKEIPGMFFIA